MTFQIYGNVIIPSDELIFFRGVGIPATSKMFGILFMMLHIISVTSQPAGSH